MAQPPKSFRPTPPDKGSFPLDHDGECRPAMIQYLECLGKADTNASLCREFSQKYLKCRMDTQLMAQEEWSRLGFKDSQPDSSHVPNPSNKKA